MGTKSETYLYRRNIGLASKNIQVFSHFDFSTYMKGFLVMMKKGWNKGPSAFWLKVSISVVAGGSRGGRNGNDAGVPACRTSASRGFETLQQKQKPAKTNLNKVEREVLPWEPLWEYFQEKERRQCHRKHFWRGFETTDVKNAMDIMLEANKMLLFVQSLQRLCQCWYSCCFFSSSFFKG